MKSDALRQKFLEYFEKNGHKIVPSSSLLPTDPSVLFTTAGMQQFKPYYIGEKSPYGNKVASCQKCIRTSDIEEVGDERHLTFFEMLGNFSFAASAESFGEGGAGYFKEEAIKLAYDFIVKELKLEIDYVTVFKGDENVPEDKESFEIWKKLGVSENKIKKEGADNFWGPTGDEGPCGPTTEIYVNGIEIWNIVFNQYFCDKNKKLENLKTPGIDTGMGLERLAMVMQKVLTVFETDLFSGIFEMMPAELSKQKQRIIADHARAIVFLASEGVKPSNKEQGYILRRLIRRIVVYEFLIKKDFIRSVIAKVFVDYKKIYEEINPQLIVDEYVREEKKFLETLEKGIAEYNKIKDINAEKAFYLYQSFGLPFDILKELDAEKTKNLKREDFESELKKHQKLSRTASAGMFKGGLADASEQTTKLHTATHLLLAGLRKVLGDEVLQKGANITAERIRFDFSHKEKMTSGQIGDVENFVNGIIKKDMPVWFEEMNLEKAKGINAMGVFEHKYGENVKVYFVGKDAENVSAEICGGPHVERTGVLGKFKIIKEESSSAGIRRIKAILE
ncbi:MAG: hypothetical protein A2528_00300 [Candidatus Staskawiczbacteria bacterium RIFOXYD2_FULL_37_9]|uniref:alanine--tRNA ligase n=1 Tax=Candidatus Staskawiczbacteria bacterium RIFOXYB1_FULL_37_44 TaxID=1802223 RepID=A0A1G2IXH3_9BACT|nr:MAG: hypothetical protein A2358_01155 [Candidatus Staskawiczbacteria bacterium RIFOXYB1_FULL_37_44]OGZ84247.1 MAG: hypothetical protein A2416_02795 [Candidatus Staskawiczbacteria bacterium RIFOXYC1_FULL_37_52]OGZ89740.1 MAG: hypothetical protein A2581_01135 [Candidatus Staskawiczbacteria bacterium RIFOXYD1_FULL_37_110]OGZ92765.1 MAG: hypothetical protein A2528_00300 [Candidatus Staskawiczbacteria bacterium RIFOXYD2_FULL_37_9]